MIGVAYGVPYFYFLLKGRLRGKLLYQSTALLALGGMQGAIGWWMVKSGLQEDLEHPRVNNYRLATHLGSALVIFSSLLWLGLNEVTKDKKIELPVKQIPRYLSKVSLGALALVFTTAMTGALVAGRDAGLIYNDTIVIPAEEREHDLDARLQWRHRVLGVTTSLSVAG